jgi:monothiol glutaredoxin
MSTPVIRLSDSARRALQDAAVGAGGDPLRIRISDRWEYDLFFGSRAEGDLDVDCGGITILLDPSSARRADGLSIDFLVGQDAAGFTIENPNEPPKVKQISATELKAMMNRGLSFELVDVRTEDERAIAKIEGSRLLNEEGHDYLLNLDRNTTIVFHCHHGIRSQSAAEYFLREKGFRNLYNLQGGIDAWSQLVDPSVPRY